MRVALTAGVALIVGIGIAVWMNQAGTPEIDPGAQVADYRPDFRHGDLDGNWVTPGDFGERVLLVNFWATWCAPCRREMPLLQELSEQYEALAVVGIAIDEPGAVRDYIEDIGVTYPILIGASDVRATQQEWGNPQGALPYTVIVDREGMIRWQHLGEVTRGEIRPVIDRLL